ncbi:MAG: aspartate-semialdehyde dehydrogenase [Candidatus Omnitrophica bacterium]|nr:aspartate-semialdehyde dehydrogenase [Candidatus Omnitrophota bacterium]
MALIRLKILRERNFPVNTLKILATRERTEEIVGEKFKVEKTTGDSFKDIDIALFAGTEGAKGASRQFGWTAVEKGALVIDNGDDFRMDTRVPLVVPEVNPEALKKHHFISNPNCSTIQLVMALFPLHRKAKIKRVIVSTYQAVSGTGKAAVRELEEETRDFLAERSIQPEVYPHRIAFNLFPQVGALSKEHPGYYTEEVKFIRETRKILNEPHLAISATCVRVPIFNSHSEAITVEFEEKITPEEAKQILTDSPGIKVIDAPENSLYPTPFDVSGKDEVFLGRIRENPLFPNGLDLWVVADNIRKGAALNAVQIAELLIEKGE